MHALIIEDEHLVSLAIANVLGECGFSSFAFAVSSEAAIESAWEQCPDLITSDVRLALGCGIEAVQSICSETTIPVIFITGNGADVRRRLPGQQILDKPFSDVGLIAAVSLALKLPGQS